LRDYESEGRKFKSCRARFLSEHEEGSGLDLSIEGNQYGKIA
jgi:hypothetical protein